jgi:hypothetical protein
MQLTRGLKAPGFQVISYQVKSWFQILPFKLNLHRYFEGRHGGGRAGRAGKYNNQTEYKYHQTKYPYSQTDSDASEHGGHESDVHVKAGLCTS